MREPGRLSYTAFLRLPARRHMSETSRNLSRPMGTHNRRRQTHRCAVSRTPCMKPAPGSPIHYRGSAGAADDTGGDAECRAPRLGDHGAGRPARYAARCRGSWNGSSTHSGRLDILVNNASTFYPTPLDDVTHEHWDDLMGTNLKAPLFLTQAAAPICAGTRAASSTSWTFMRSGPCKHHTVYGPAKAALAMLTRTLAKDLAPRDPGQRGVARGDPVARRRHVGQGAGQYPAAGAAGTAGRPAGHRRLRALPRARCALRHRADHRRGRRAQRRLVARSPDSGDTAAEPRPAQDTLARTALSPTGPARRAALDSSRSVKSCPEIGHASRRSRGDADWARVPPGAAARSHSALMSSRGTRIARSGITASPYSSRSRSRVRGEKGFGPALRPARSCSRFQFGDDFARVGIGLERAAPG